MCHVMWKCPGMADVLVVQYGRDASWCGYLSKDKVQISCGIEAEFNNYLRPGIIILCRG